MTTSMTTTDRLRQVIAEIVQIDAQALQAAIGRLVVATSAEHPSAPAGALSVHDAAAGVTVLLADRIPAGQEAQVLAAEIERHHGRQTAQAVLGDQADELLGADGNAARAIQVHGQEFNIGPRELVGGLIDYAERFADSNGEPVDGDCRSLIRSGQAWFESGSATIDIDDVGARLAEYVTRFADSNGEPEGGNCRRLLERAVGLFGPGKLSNYTHQQLGRITELDAAIDAAADQGDEAFFTAVAAKDEYIDSQGIDRDRLEVTGREAQGNVKSRVEQPEAFFDSKGALHNWETGEPMRAGWTGIAKRGETLFAVGKDGDEMSYTALQAKTMAAARDEIRARELQPDEKVVRAIADADLLAEINRRGILQPIYGAIGAVHDHLDRTGALDERLTQYLVYRLRREEAAITGMPDSADRVANWQGCIDELDREGRREEGPSM